MIQLTAIVARQFGWPFHQLRDMPMTLLLAYVQAANWLEGAPTSWLAADEASAQQTFKQLKALCNPSLPSSISL